MTRPQHQAAKLCALIATHGGQAISFPSIAIQPVDARNNILAGNDALSKYDFVIFISRNAVKIAFDHYLHNARLPRRLQFVAIGAGTKDALAAFNIIDVLQPDGRADSETLLQLPAFQTEKLTGKKILIIRGVGGREYLAENLSRRGADVDYAEIYRRCLPKYEVKDTHKIWQDGQPAAIIVSSNESLINLVKLTLEIDKPQLFNTPLVLMSARNDAVAKEWGFVAKTRIATDKNDAGLLSALLDLVGE